MIFIAPVEVVSVLLLFCTNQALCIDPFKHYRFPFAVPIVPLQTSQYVEGFSHSRKSATVWSN